MRRHCQLPNSQVPFFFSDQIFLCVKTVQNFTSCNYVFGAALCKDSIFVNMIYILSGLWKWQACGGPAVIHRCFFSSDHCSGTEWTAVKRTGARFNYTSCPLQRVCVLGAKILWLHVYLLKCHLLKQRLVIIQDGICLQFADIFFCGTWKESFWRISSALFQSIAVNLQQWQKTR